MALMEIGKALQRVEWKRAAVVGLVCLLSSWPRSAAAQPVFKIVHDWRIDIGGETFGLREVAIEITANEYQLQYTQIFLGPWVIHVRYRAMHILAALSVITLGFAACEIFRRIPFRKITMDSLEDQR